MTLFVLFNLCEHFLTSQIRAFLVICSAIIVDRSRALACMQELGYADTFLSDMFNYLDSFTTFFPCKLGAMALAALLAMPEEQLPASYQSAYSQIFAASMMLLRIAKETQPNEDEQEIDYDQLLERIQGQSFKENDWGYDDENDVKSEDLTDDELRHLQEIGGSYGCDFVEIDQDLYNSITAINYLEYVQQCLKIFGNSKPVVANTIFGSLNMEDAEFINNLMKLTFEEEN